MAEETREILVINVIEELEKKVRDEYAKIEAKQKHGLSSEQGATLRDLLFAGIGGEMLNEYKEKGIEVRGRTYLRTKIRYAETNLGVRYGDLASGADTHIIQIRNEAETDYLRKNGFLTGSVRDISTGLTEEDFGFGLPPQGGRYLEAKAFGLEAGKTRMMANKKYEPGNRKPDDIIRTIPRKYKIEHQMYTLDVEGTLKNGGIGNNSFGYNKIRAALEKEKQDPEKIDELQKMYTEIEIRALIGVSELDD